LHPRRWRYRQHRGDVTPRDQYAEICRVGRGCIPAVGVTGNIAGTQPRITNMQNLPFQEFLAQLEQQGFTIGVEHHLRLQTVLNVLPPDCKPSDVKFYLCPIFAANAKQQQQFYHAFDAYFAAFEPERVREAERQTEERRKAAPPLPEPKRWQFVLFGVLITILVMVVSFQWQYGAWLLPSLRPTPTPTVAATPVPEMSPTPETTVTPEAAPTAVPTPQAATTGISWRYRALLFYIDYRLQIRLLLVLTPLLALVLMEAWRWQQRKLALERRRGKRPPRVWPIRVDAPPLPFLQHDPLRSAARLLRRRVTGNRREIDVNASLKATLAAGLFPTLRYRHVTRPPEYLILIELPAWRDHAAQFADSIAEALQHDAVFVERYFYERDPRVCFREPDGERELLADLLDRYRDHRLILIGTGDSLLDPISGAFEGYAALFLEWRDRAMLTPAPVSEWGMREVTLAREFALLPATLEGLAELAEFWDNPTSPPNLIPSTSSGHRSKGEGETSPLSFEAGLLRSREHLSLRGASATKQSGRMQGLFRRKLLAMTERNSSAGVGFLRDYLGEPVFQWLCACAVYTELRWNLTILLATLPCMPKNLLTEENLLRLIRLPYFREGVMPDELRWELIGALTPETERAIRTALVTLLEQNPPPEGSIAAEGFQLTLAAQRLWALGKNRDERNTLKKKMRQSGDLRLLQDYTLVRFLEGASASPLRFVLPRRLRKLFFRHGLPLFGLKNGVRLALALLLVVSFFVVERNLARAIQKELFETMVRIPAGEFVMGIAPQDVRKLSLQYDVTRDYFMAEVHDGMGRITNEFLIDRDEVTNKEYVDYLNQLGTHQHNGISLITLNSESSMSRILREGEIYRVIDNEYQRHPVVMVNWAAARAYCEWQGKRLPSEAEWERAARGTNGNVFPWGNEFAPDKANLFQYWPTYWYDHAVPEDQQQEMTLAVGSFPDGRSPEGVEDMTGNVWEWTNDLYTVYPGNTNTDGMYNVWHNDENYRVVRGGAFDEYHFAGRASMRFPRQRDVSYDNVGFRCVADVDGTK